MTECYCADRQSGKKCAAIGKEIRGRIKGSMVRIKTLLGLILCTVILTGCAGKEPALEEIVQEGENKFSCSFDGVKHDFVTELPEETEGAPLVLMLHGYGSTAEAFRTMVHFEKEAVPAGYGIVYVSGAPDPNDATSAGGWNSGIGAEGNDDVGFLVSLAKYLQEQYGFDRDRTYAAGFSNGAFMTHRLAMEASDTFRAVVSVAGMMTENVWNERNDSNSVSVFQITGGKDDVVPKHSDGTARFTKAPAIEDVMEYWSASNGLSLSETTEIGKNNVLYWYGSEAGEHQVWHLWIKDGRHSWPEEAISGIRTNELILEFLNGCN